jgi:CopG family transcriptional regulator/antitoxin EndoAI
MTCYDTVLNEVASMRNTKVVSISLPSEMLEAAELMAKQENRTMSELMREALRVYQRERRAWQDVFAHGGANAKRLGINDEQDIVRMVREYRQQKRNAQASDRKTGTK